MPANTSTSTRTFMPPPPDKDKMKPKAPKPKRDIKLPKFQLSPWLLVLALVLFSVFMFSQYREAQRKLENPANNTKQVTSTVEKVSKLIILPKDETPTIVTVKDASKLKSEAFYKDAQNGDITLVYQKEKKAILYRPSDNIIVNVANVTVTPTNSN